MTKQHIAQSFGTLLDQDDFEGFKKLLAADCVYHIHEDILHGGDEIAGLYEQNMKAGKKKFDKLEWGECSITALSEDQFMVHFSDFITHGGQTHNYKCNQIISINDDLVVTTIKHQEIPGEREAFEQYLSQFDTFNHE